MISRRKIAAALAIAPVIALATQSGRAQSTKPAIPLVGVLSPLSATAAKANIDAFRQGLREVGLVEGQSVVLELSFADGLPERLPGLAAEMVARDPAVILAGSAPGVLAASRATKSIPIVLASPFADPVALGLAASLAHPAGNVTGFALADGAELYGKRLQVLKEILPRMARVAVILNPNDPTDSVMLEWVRAAAPALRLSFDVFEVREAKEIEIAFAGARQRCEALLISQSPLFNSNRARVVALANQHRLPAIYGFSEFAKEGGLLVYSVSLPDMYRRSADYVARILRGERPADLPIQQPTKFDFVVNIKTAEALGITIPQSILLRADEVIE